MASGNLAAFYPELLQWCGMVVGSETVVEAERLPGLRVCTFLDQVTAGPTQRQHLECRKITPTAKKNPK